MNRTGADPGQFAVDTYSVLYHGYAHTHMDSLCHMFYEGKMFNGYPKESTDKEGASKLSIAGVKNGIFTRGILMDIPRLKGVKYLEPKNAYFILKTSMRGKTKPGSRLGAGDVIFIRTGRWARRAGKGPVERQRRIRRTPCLLRALAPATGCRHGRQRCRQ
jgi:hypothetical protein